jgi:integrase
MTSKIRKHVGKRGVSYQVTVELPPDPKTGKRRQKLLTARTKKEAETLAAQLVANIANGGFGEAEAKKLTLSQYLARWYPSLEGAVRPSTQRRYQDVLTQHVEPMLGTKNLSKLTPLEVQALYAEKLSAGLSPTTVALIHNILHRALKQAVRWGLLTRNVTEAVTPPREAKLEYVTWNEQQVREFLVVSDGDEWAALWRLALTTGMRRGEILGLRWEDVDLDKGVLSVRRTLSRGTGGTYTYGTPKTTTGKRSIALTRSAVDSLKAHRRRQVEDRLKSPIYKDEDLVFADSIGEPLHPNSLAYRFNKLIARAGVPRIRFHDLRHTSATLMLANGEHPKIVQERLGHADISMTLNRYSHVTMDMQRLAADRLDALIGEVG